MALPSSPSTRGTVRRARLVRAASEQFHRHGVNATALADVARSASIPPGNMFYYFRTKDALAEAVVGDWVERIAAGLAEFDAESDDPRERLRSFLDRAEGRGPVYAEWGCPLAGIARDLRQLSVAPQQAAAPLRLLIDWVARQLAAAGDAEALVHAQFVVAAIQGSFVLAHASGEAAVVSEVRRCLDAWIARDAGPTAR